MERQDPKQVLQLVYDQDRKTYRADALMHEDDDGVPPWTPLAGPIKDGGTILGHAKVWNGSTWVNFTG